MAKLIDLAKDDWDIVSLTREKARYHSRRTSAAVEIPLSEIGDGRLLATERGATLLKWIRSNLDTQEAQGGG